MDKIEVIHRFIHIIHILGCVQRGWMEKNERTGVLWIVIKLKLIGKNKRIGIDF